MSNPTRLTWLWRRLRVMSTAEIMHRLMQLLRNRLPGARRWPDAHHPLVQAIRHSDFLTSGETQLYRLPLQPDPEHKTLLLSGQLPCFGRWLSVGSDSFWHRDPFSGAAWPREERIDYRPGNPHGDVRIVWEINRLQHLFSLAVIASEDPAVRTLAVSVIKTQLLDWWQANPPGQGVNYLSAMEEALRLISLLHAYDLVRTDISNHAADVLAELVTGHALHIERHLSLYSSAGNHTIAEATGLLHAGLLFPECHGSERWRRKARQLLAAQAGRQVLDDGGGLEQATWYLLFITDLMGLASELLRFKKEPAIPALDEALERARRFLNTIARNPADLPRIGDSDDGWALSPWLRLNWQEAPPAPRHKTFTQAGLSIASFRGDDRLIFLHNPLGMPPSFGHGHADALSVLFSWNGMDLLIDPGTGQYGGHPAQRRYFRSSRAHNTATVNNYDHAQQLTAFMWAEPYDCQLAFSSFEPDHVLLLACTDAWHSHGVTHWRAVSYRDGQYLAIRDWLSGPSAAAIKLHWHFRYPLMQDGEHLELHPPGCPPIILSTQGASIRILSGETSPFAGWYSPTYGETAPCHMLELTPSSIPQREICTVLWLNEANDQTIPADDFAILKSFIQ